VDWSEAVTTVNTAALKQSPEHTATTHTAKSVIDPASETDHSAARGYAKTTATDDKQSSAARNAAIAPDAATEGFKHASTAAHDPASGSDTAHDAPAETDHAPAGSDTQGSGECSE
jgi:hypothetical protein